MAKIQLGHLDYNTSKKLPPTKGKKHEFRRSILNVKVDQSIDQHRCHIGYIVIFMQHGALDILWWNNKTCDLGRWQGQFFFFSLNRI